MTTQDAPQADAGAETIQIVPTESLVTVRVWQLPVRVAHWTVVASVAALSITGFYIGTPYLSTRGDTGFLMGWMRYVHNLAAWIFVAAIIARVIFAFTGNRWARWDQFLPIGAKRRKNARAALMYYVFLRRDPPTYAGHNALAGMTYLVLFAMFVLQIFTGMAMYGLEYPTSIAATLSGWVFSIFSVPTVRMIHHLVMWLTWGFIVHHVYSASLMDVEEKTGLLSSIVTGWKRVPSDWLE